MNCIREVEKGAATVLRKKKSIHVCAEEVRLPNQHRLRDAIEGGIAATRAVEKVKILFHEG